MDAARAGEGHIVTSETRTEAQHRADLEALVGGLVREVLPAGVGVALFLFDLGAGGALAYAASATRDSVRKALCEWLAVTLSVPVPTTPASVADLRDRVARVACVLDVALRRFDRDDPRVYVLGDGAVEDAIHGRVTADVGATLDDPLGLAVRTAVGAALEMLERAAAELDLGTTP